MLSIKVFDGLENLTQKIMNHIVNNIVGVWMHITSTVTIDVHTNIMNDGVHNLEAEAAVAAVVSSERRGDSAIQDGKLNFTKSTSK
jgi:hypothetical protein